MTEPFEAPEAPEQGPVFTPPPFPAPQPGAWAGAAPPRGTHRYRVGAAAVAVAVVAAGTGIGVGHALWDGSSSTSAAGAPAASAPAGATTSPSASTGSSSGSTSSGSTSGGTGSSGTLDAAAIASKVDPGLVDIDTVLGYQDEKAAGTGIVLSSNGIVLTNNHVISGATSISVYDVGNGKTYAATVVGYDRTADIAVLSLTGASKLQTAVLGSSSNLAVGQAVVGIGNAEGAGGTPSYAGGSVVALDQSITASDEGTGTSEQLSNLIETNADIEPGDSGGALVNAAGKVVGVDTAASSGESFTGGEGGAVAGGQGATTTEQAYAIPIDEALSLAKEIRAGDASSTVHIGATAFLGVEVAAQSSSFAGASSASGTTIAGVISGTPAATAGLSAGDTITAINGVSVSTANALTATLEQYHPGNTVTVTWTDTSGASHTTSVTLATGPAD